MHEYKSLLFELIKMHFSWYIENGKKFKTLDILLKSSHILSCLLPPTEKLKMAI